jgi:hypothetical protein
MLRGGFDQPLHDRAVILTYHPAYYHRTFRTYKHTNHAKHTKETRMRSTYATQHLEQKLEYLDVTPCFGDRLTPRV